MQWYCAWFSWKLVRAPELRLHVGSRVERIDPLHLLAGCRKRRLNQALSVLCLRLYFFWVCHFDYVALVCVCLCSVSWMFWFGCQYQCRWLTGKILLQNNPYHVDGDVKSCSLIHQFSLNIAYDNVAQEFVDYDDFNGPCSVCCHLYRPL